MFACCCAPSRVEGDAPREEAGDPREVRDRAEHEMMEKELEQGSSGAIPRRVLKNEDHLEEFQVMVKRADQQPLGMNFVDKVATDFPVIDSLSPTGLISDWNVANALSKTQVKPSSYIIEANGKQSPDEILEECRDADRLTLWIERKNKYTVFLPEKKKLLGLDIDRKSLEVEQLTRPSAGRPASVLSLAGWNENCEAGCEIRVRDRLIQVNQVTDPAQLLITINDATGPLELIFERFMG